MEFFWGRQETPEETLRQNQRALTRATRELDQERQNLKQQEEKIIADIKKMAKQGQMDVVKIMARNLVHTRRYVKKITLMRANIQAVSLKIQTLKCNFMAQAMTEVAKNMATMNRQLKLPQIQKIMMEFKEQSEILDMKEEMINAGIADAMDDEKEEEETNAEVSRVLDELYLTLTDKLSKLPFTGGSLNVARIDYERKVSENTWHRSLLCSRRPVRGPMLTPIHHQNAYNVHRSIRTGAGSNERRWPGLMNKVFFSIIWIAGCVCLNYLWRRWH